MKSKGMWSAYHERGRLERAGELLTFLRNNAFFLSEAEKTAAIVVGFRFEWCRATQVEKNRARRARSKKGGR